uniref:Small ribosomal subunit protein uS4c n=1 Tax=Prototheca cutis TaxID=575411 RepID=A0A2Z6BES8_9CHLO|nr:ribosomal protein s4 [Prototheca cutis]BBD20230.1 ribosomal protein s4 [Prototheca cutis]
MSRYRGPKLRILRRLGELPGFSQKEITRRTPPGQHGKKKMAGFQKQYRETSYAIRLKEKQKLKFNYGVHERQLINYIKKARRKKGSTGEILLQFLEMRLDNIIYRLGFAPTIPAARQLINHGHIIVNQTHMNIPSYNCKINDTISIIKQSLPLILSNLERSNSDISSFASLKETEHNIEATIMNLIPRDSVQLKLNELLVVEYYSRKV